MATTYIGVPQNEIPVYPTAASFPVSAGNGDQVVAADTSTIYVFSTGSMTWLAVATPGAAIALDALTGDVTATGPGTAPATVQAVGGSTATAVNAATILANAATSANTASAIVRRDVSGNFSAGTITASNVIDSGLSVSTALVTDGSKQLTSSVTTATELSYSSGVTSAIQTQLNGKQATLTIGNLTDTGTDGIIVTGGTGAVIGSGTSVAQHVADTTHNGYLSSADWNTFNSKQAAGSYITALTGDVTAAGPGSSAATVAKIQSTVVSGTTGSGNVVFSAAPTLTGLLSGSSATFSSTIGASNFSGTSSGTNTGDVTLGTASGLSLAAQVLSLALSSTSTTGALSSTDWNTFNNKQAALTLGNLTDVGTDGITITGGTGAVVGSGTAISQRVADATHNGYLVSTDWVIFNAKQASGNYITALTGDVTATGPGSVASTVAKIAGTTVSGTTGSTNVVFSTSPAISAAALSGATTMTDAGSIINATTASKVLAFNLGGMSTSTTLTLSSSQSTSQTLTLPNITGSDTVGTLALAQTYTGAKTFSAAVTLGAGLVGTPSINVSDSGTGLYRPGANILAFTANGNESGRITASGNWQIGTTAFISNTAERIAALNSDSGGGNVTYATAATQITLTSTTPYTGTGGVNSAWNRLQRTISTSTTDTGMMGASLNVVRFNISAGQTLTNSSTDGIYGNIILASSNQGAGVVASTLYSGFRVQADSLNTGTNKAGISIGNITGASSNYAILTGTGLVSLADTTQSTTTATGAIISLGGLGLAKNLTTGGAVSTAGYDTSSPVTGNTVTASANTPGLLLTPAGTLATLTVRLPSSPIDGQQYWVATSQTITSVTWQDAGGTAGNVIGGAASLALAGARFVYNASGTKWYSIA